MNLFLRYRLRRFSRKANPDKAFEADLRRKLRVQACVKTGWIPFAWKLAAVPTLVTVLTVSGTGAYAYASDSVGPGSKLYPVKKSLEKVEEKLTVKQEAKILVAIKHLDRRIQEDRAIFKRGKDLPKARLDDLNSKMKAVEKQISAIPETKRLSLQATLSGVKLKLLTLESDVNRAKLDNRQQKELRKVMDEDIELSD